MFGNRSIDDLKAALSTGRFLLDRGLFEAAKYYYRGAVIRIAIMNTKKIGRKLLKNTYTKNDVRNFRNTGKLFYIAWIGMYVPHFYQNTMTVVPRLKSIIKNKL